jgi:hypothetical protein
MADSLCFLRRFDQRPLRKLAPAAPAIVQPEAQVADGVVHDVQQEANSQTTTIHNTQPAANNNHVLKAYLETLPRSLEINLKKDCMCLFRALAVYPIPRCRVDFQYRSWRSALMAECYRRPRNMTPRSPTTTHSMPVELCTELQSLRNPESSTLNDYFEVSANGRSLDVHSRHDHFVPVPLSSWPDTAQESRGSPFCRFPPPFRPPRLQKIA